MEEEFRVSRLCVYVEWPLSYHHVGIRSPRLVGWWIDLLLLLPVLGFRAAAALFACGFVGRLVLVFRC